MSTVTRLAAPTPSALPPDRDRGFTLAFVGLVLYLWVIHSYKAPIGTAAIGLGLFGLLVGRYRTRVPRPLVWFGVFILWAAVTSPFAADPDTALDALESFSKLWLIALVAANVAHTRRQLALLVVAWLALFALYPVRGTLFNFVSGVTHFGRTAWNFTFSNPNDLAALTLPMFALAIMMLQDHRRVPWVRAAALAGVVLLPLLVVITQSRGGILALGTMGLLILAEYRRQARTLAIAALAGGVILLAAPPESWERLRGLVSARDEVGLRAVDAEGSAEQRFEIWRVAAAIAADHPVTGVGLGNYAQAHAQYAASTRFNPTARGRRDTHSIYLNALAETGAVGLLLLLAMFGSALRAGFAAARRIAPTDLSAARQLRTLGIGLVALMQAGIFGTLHGVAFLYVYIGVMTASERLLAPAPDGASALRRGPASVAGWQAAPGRAAREGRLHALPVRARAATPRRSGEDRR